MKSSPVERRILNTSMMIIAIILATLLLIEGFALAVLYRQLKGNQTYWQERAREPVPDGAVRYIALGDSAAQAVGATNPKKGYVGLIANSLERKLGKPVHTTNISISGAKVQDVIDRQLPQLEKLNVTPETYVTIEIGANDMPTYNGPQFSLEMDDLMSQLPPQTVISDLPYFGGGRARNLESSVLQANKAIRRLAAKYQLRVAPLHEVTKQNDNILTYGADYFHPSNRGYRNWYEAFWKTLQ